MCFRVKRTLLFTTASPYLPSRPLSQQRGSTSTLDARPSAPALHLPHKFVHRSAAWPPFQHSAYHIPPVPDSCPVPPCRARLVLCTGLSLLRGAYKLAWTPDSNIEVPGSIPQLAHFQVLGARMLNLASYKPRVDAQPKSNIGCMSYRYYSY